MTLQELAALPAGARVRMQMDSVRVHDELTEVYEYATVIQGGNEVHLSWDIGTGSWISTKSLVWGSFVDYLEVA
jgi:hypothetical protein